MSFCEENAVQPRTRELYRKYFDLLTTYLSGTDVRPGPWTEEVLNKDQVKGWFRTSPSSFDA
eukprot:9168173-Alexandrium_andersonii.AAC.1